MKLKFTVETTYEGTPPASKDAVPPASATTEKHSPPRSDSATGDYSASMLASPNPHDQQDYQYPPPPAPKYPHPAYPPPPPTAHPYPPAPSPRIAAQPYPPSAHPYPTAPPPSPPAYSYPPPPYYPPTAPPSAHPYPPPPYYPPTSPPPAVPHPYPPAHLAAPHPYPPAPPSALEINSAEKIAAILIVCLVGLQLLPVPTWEKIENLPPAQILRSIVNPTAAPPVSYSKQQSSILLHGPPVFPLAGLSGKKAIPVSIPGDCRPLGSCNRKHAGADYSATPGWPVLAIEGGTINEVNPDSSVGGIIGIKSTHLDEVYRYVHLDRDSVRPFKVGDFIPKGSVIGLIGSTFPGSSGPHGHFERYLKGKLDWKVHEHLKTAIALPKP